MPITRNYGPNPALVGEMSYAAGNQMQDQESLLAMLQLLSGIRDSNMNRQMQEKSLAQQKKEAEDALKLQYEQLYGNPAWVANRNLQSPAASGVGSGYSSSRWSAF